MNFIFLKNKNKNKKQGRGYTKPPILKDAYDHRNFTSNCAVLEVSS